LDALKRALVCLVASVCFSNLVHAQGAGTVLVAVTSAAGAVGNAEVRAGAATALTAADGTASLSVPPGRVDVVVTRSGYDAAATSVEVATGQLTRVEIEMQPQSGIEETIIVSATRTEARLEDQPMRVEVLAREEIEEKMLMTPGDIVMMLNEMGGMRVQVTSPSLGAASHAVFLGRPAAVRRSGRPRAAADSADGSGTGRSDQGGGVIAVRRRGDGRRGEPDFAAPVRRA
jgi:iron complex outermembrane receptor protein